jgi:hypothetical protein
LKAVKGGDQEGGFQIFDDFLGEDVGIGRIVGFGKYKEKQTWVVVQFHL